MKATRVGQVSLDVEGDLDATCAFHAAVSELEARSIEYVRGAQGPVVPVWVVDPAGNTVELEQDRT